MSRQEVRRRVVSRDERPIGTSGYVHEWWLALECGHRTHPPAGITRARARTIRTIGCPQCEMAQGMVRPTT